MKKILNVIIVCMLFITVFITNVEVNAIEAGATMDTAIDITFGKTYNKIWTSDNDDLNFYALFKKNVAFII